LNFAETPKAFANFSPGFEHRENPGKIIPIATETLKGLGAWRTPSESVGKIPSD